MKCASILTGGKGAAEAAENRNYLTARMTEELHEIIRVLQLTTYDEDEWDVDNLTVMKKAHNAIQSKIRAARDWLLVGLVRISLSCILELLFRKYQILFYFDYVVLYSNLLCNSAGYFSFLEAYYSGS